MPDEIREGAPIHSVHLVDAVSLFLFSAATALPHRIHYDREYARLEGHADLPVHGPLQGAWMAEAVAEWARTHGGRLTMLRYRNVAPANAGDQFTVSGTIVAAEVERSRLDLTIVSVAGDLVTTGVAEVTLVRTDGAGT